MSGIIIQRLPPFRKRLRASDFRCRAMLQEQLLSSDGMGGTTQRWDDIAEFWIDIRPMGVHEINQAALVNSIVDTRILMRDPGDLTQKLSATGSISRLLRFVYGSHVYRIAGINDHGDIIEVICAEKQPTD